MMRHIVPGWPVWLFLLLSCGGEKRPSSDPVTQNRDFPREEHWNLRLNQRVFPGRLIPSAGRTAYALESGSTAFWMGDPDQLPPDTRTVNRVPSIIARDGTPVFLMGINYMGAHDRCWRMWEPEWFDEDLIRKDFEKIQEYGWNAVRIVLNQALADQIAAGDFSRLDFVVNECRRTHTYLLITFHDYPEKSVEQVADLNVRVAARYADEPVVLGYDLKNEPFPETLETLIYPDTHPLPPRPPEGRTEDYLDRLFGNWVQYHVERIRRVAPEALLTVGHAYGPMTTVPSNELLDFASHHLYATPLSPERVWSVIQSLMRLQEARKTLPTLYGEFGISNVINRRGVYVEVREDVSACFELLYYVYAYASHFSGAFKWMLNDPLHHRTTLPYEANLGAFAEGDRPKPVAFGVRAFRAILDRFPDCPGARIFLSRDDNLGIRFTFITEGAMIASGTKLEENILMEFEGKSAYPVVFLTWDGESAAVETTAPARISMATPGYLVGSAGMVAKAGNPGQLPDQEVAWEWRNERFVFDVEPGLLYHLAPSPERVSGPKPLPKWDAAPYPSPIAPPIIEGRFNVDRPVLNSSFETDSSYWAFLAEAFGRCEWETEVTHSGRRSLRLILTESRGFAQANTFPSPEPLNLKPSTTYRLSFQARVLSGNGFLQANFEHPAGASGPQIDIDLGPPGDWMEIEALIPTGSYDPIRGQPFFRIWAINSRQDVLIDDLRIVAPE